MIRAGEWRVVPGFSTYEVSDAGQVRSLRSGKPIVLSQWVDGRGYPTVHAMPDGTTKRRKVDVHTMVALAFIGPRPGGHHVRHLDGDSLNNAAANLSYGTVSENIRDQVRHGTHRMARRTHCANGHEFTPENTRIHEKPRHRECLTCTRIQSAASNERRRIRNLARKGAAA